MAEVAKRQISADDRQALMTFALEAVEQMRRDIPEAACYKDKDLIFECANNLFGMMWFLSGPPTGLPEEQQMKIKALAMLIRKEQYIETTLDALFEQPAVTEADINRLLYWAKECTDEYQKGKLFVGLGRQQLGKLNEGARRLLQEYMASELRRLMELDTEDSWNVLLILADVCRYFANEAIIYALLELVHTDHHRVACFAMDTLYFLGEDVPQAVIDTLASELEFAHFTYEILKTAGKSELFPTRYKDGEYLAKSALCTWLTFPTELGKMPDEIELLGKIKRFFKRDTLYIFKFRSDSDTLDDENKNQWLVGWHSSKNYSFSHFDRLSAFQSPNK